MNWLPAPGVLCAQIVPWCSSTMRTASESPSPAPGILPAALPRTYFLKIKGNSSAGMPSPWSITSMRKFVSCRRNRNVMTLSAGEYLTALDNRLERRMRSSWGSLRIPVQTGHAVHGKLDSHSRANWTLIPR